MARVTNSAEHKASKLTVKQPQTKRGAVISNAVNAAKAKRGAKKIMKALDEAEQIHKGKRKGETFDKFLKKL